MTEEVPVTLARIEAKLDRVISDNADHETRVRRLERWMWGAVAAGGTGALSGLWSLLGG